MGKPAVSFRYKLIILCAAVLLACGLAPATILASESVAGGFDAERSAASPFRDTPPESQNDARSASPNSNGEAATLNSSTAGNNGDAVLASTLTGPTSSILSADVTLEGNESLIGSFTVDGFTYSIGPDGLMLVSVDPAAASDGTVAMPESATYNGVTYPVTAIAPYAFYLSGVMQVELPATVTSVDDRAFRSSDVERVEVAVGNPTYASFDGALYSADKLRLLLIPEGRKGSVLLSCETEVVEPSKFSHCSLVDVIAVEEGGAASFASWNGLLYSADGTTLLRVSAGATEITIHDGCTTIGAGAMEGCANLERINAPASVASISPDIFTSVPTISLPASTLVEDAPQLIAMVALASVEDDLLDVNPPSIGLFLSAEADERLWEERGFSVEEMTPEAATNAAAAYRGASVDAFNLNTVTAYCHARMDNRNTVVASATNHESSISPNAVKRLPLVRPALNTSQISGGRADFINITASMPTSGSTWLSTQRMKGDVADISEFFWIYYEQDAKTVVSNYCASSPSPIFFYNPSYPTADRTITWNANGGACSTAATAAPAMTKVTSPIATRTGYVHEGWYVAPGFPFAGQKVCDSGAETGLIVANRTLEARWVPNAYTIELDAQGGPETASLEATYDQDVTLPFPGIRNGYVFEEWNTKVDGTGASYQADVVLSKPNFVTDGVVTLYAQWVPAISADVPLEVTAKVDMLGLEKQQQAQGYIESRCGEALKVTDINFEPLSGASELFGAANMGDIFLDVRAGTDASPNVRFALDASSSQAPGVPASFHMASYGTRVPIAYSFEIPEALLPNLVETTKPVCSVSYTVALA